MQTGEGYDEFRRGWKIVLSSLLGIGLGLSPLPYYTLGVFAPHLTAAFGWPIDRIMFGLTVMTLMVLWAAPLTGLLAQKYGVRRIAITSIILFSLAFMSLGLMTNSLTHFYLTWALIAIVGAGTLPITFTRAVNGWFDRKRGFALGLSLMGTGIFGFFSKGLTAALIDAVGWRGAYVGLGLLPLLIALPAALLLLRESPVVQAEGEAAAVHPGGLTLRQTLLDWRFWLMAIGFFIISFALGGIPPNLEKILSDTGMPLSTVLGLTSLVGLSAIAGRVIGGWLVDAFWAPAIAFFMLAMPAISCWLLAGSDLDTTNAAVAILLVGFALGVEFDLMAFMLGRYFGLKSYTMSYAILYVFFSLGAGFGPWAFASRYGIDGSYAPALTLAAVALVLVAASFLLLGRYREFADEKAIT